MKDKSEILYEYLLSGEAIANYKILEPDLMTQFDVFQLEYHGYMVINKEALTMIDESFDDMPGLRWIIDFVNKQELKDQLLNLHGLQQVKQIHIGRDLTWSDC